MLHTCVKVRLSPENITHAQFNAFSRHTVSPFMSPDPGGSGALGCPRLLPSWHPAFPLKADSAVGVATGRLSRAPGVTLCLQLRCVCASTPAPVRPPADGRRVLSGALRVGAGAGLAADPQQREAPAAPRPPAGLRLLCVPGGRAALCARLSSRPSRASPMARDAEPVRGGPLGLVFSLEIRPWPPRGLTRGRRDV